MNVFFEIIYNRKLKINIEKSKNFILFIQLSNNGKRLYFKNESFQITLVKKIISFF